MLKNEHAVLFFKQLMDEALCKKPEIEPVATAATFSRTPKRECTTPVPVAKKLKKEDAQEARHREKMERQDKFLSLFEKMVDKL